MTINSPFYLVWYSTCIFDVWIHALSHRLSYHTLHRSKDVCTFTDKYSAFSKPVVRTDVEIVVVWEIPTKWVLQSNLPIFCSVLLLYHWKRAITAVVVSYAHDDVIKWKHFPHNWPFVRGINRSPVNSHHKGQWRGGLMFSLICAWINGWIKIVRLLIWDAIAPIMTSL